MTLDDFKYLFSNNLIMVTYRAKSKSIINNGSYCRDEHVSKEFIHDNIENNIIMYALPIKKDSSGELEWPQWESINIRPTKESIEDYINNESFNDIKKLKVEFPEKRTLHRMLMRVFEIDFNIENADFTVVYYFVNELFQKSNDHNFKKGIYSSISLDFSQAIPEQLNELPIYKDNFIKKHNGKVTEFVLWSDTYGVFSNDVKDWKKLKLYLLQTNDVRKVISFSSSSWSRMMFISFIDALKLFAEI